MRIIAVDVAKVVAGSSVQVRVGSGKYYGLSLQPDGTNAVDAIVYDNATTESGDIDAARAIATVSENYQFAHPIPFQNGLRVNVTGTNGVAYVYWTRTGKVE